MQFAPIAIVGQGCVLPGAHNPEQLWQTVLNAQMHLGTPGDQYWGIGSNQVTQTKPSPDHTWSDRGGYVRDFMSAFDANAFGLAADDVARFDPLFQWSLYAAKQALDSAGLPLDMGNTRSGVILGNLSYPTPSMSRAAQDVWSGQSLDRVESMQRFMSGLPAHVVARAFGMKAGAYSLDAACASSLYAIKLACDWLHDGKADVMLAGGVNHADDLFIHIGFCALNAMSKTGQSRPFHAQADGLVPAEGAGFVALMRLDDAIEQDRPILGLIRCVGLSNDGRGRGLLTPSEQGQVRAMKVAYEMSGLSPDDVSLIECHATGTPLGDATELRSMARIFEGRKDLPVGSLKANMGHLITASGVAGLMKVLSSMKHKVLPPVINVDEPNQALVDSPFRLVKSPEAWEPTGKRCAVVNNFGFGGNNAHLLVEAWEPSGHTYVPAQVTAPQYLDEDIAIVGLGAVVGTHDHPTDILARLLNSEALHDGEGAQVKSIEFNLKALRFPPNDLKQTLPQQLLVLNSGFALSEQIASLPQETTGILTGMQCDAEIARYGARWRLANHLDGDELKSAREAIVPGLKSAGVLGTMPNIVANRLNSQFDLLGPSFTVSSEELSGTTALMIAARSLRHGQLDAVIVNAVDMSCEPVHREAASNLLSDAYQTPADGAVTLVLKRLSDAQRDNDTIYARLPAQAPKQVTSVVNMDAEGALWLGQTGHAHAASGLLQVAWQTLCLHHRIKPEQFNDKPQPWLPQDGHRSVALRLNSFYGQEQSLVLVDDPDCAAPYVADVIPGNATRAYFARANSKAALLNMLSTGDVSSHTVGTWRASWLCDGDDAEVRGKLVDALNHYELDQGLIQVDGQLAWLGQGDVPGELAYVFTGPAGAYPGMGRELLMHMPELVDAVAQQFTSMEEAVGWIYQPNVDRDRPPVDKLWGSSFLCQTHAQWTRQVMGLEPDAAIGFCSGETNAAFALGAWHGLDEMRRDIDERGVFDVALGGVFETLKDAWNTDQPEWATWRLLVDASDVESLLEDEDRAHLTIINAPGDVVIAGEPQACERIIEQVGRQRARELGYNIVMHCPEARQFQSSWHDLHHRPTQEVNGVRFYTNATLSAYDASSDNIADALTGQAMNRVDFPALVQKAWDDGVRVFVEHGPHAGCTQWIQKTLGTQDHVAMALDRYGVSSLQQAMSCAAQLFALGYDVDTNRLSTVASTRAPEPVQEKNPLQMSFPGHWPEVTYPTIQSNQGETVSDHNTTRPEASSSAQTMAPAPTLPSVHSKAPAVTQAPIQKTQPTPVKRNGTSPVAQAPTAALSPAPATAQSVQPSQSSQAAITTVVPTQPSNHPMVGYFEQVAAIHESFLHQQAELQTQFLAQRTQMMQHLLGQTTTTITPRTIESPVQHVAAPQAVAAPAPVSAPRPTQTSKAAAPVSRPAPKVAPKPTPAPQVKRQVKPASRAVSKPASKPAPQTKAAPSISKGRPDVFHPTVKRQPIGPSFDREALKIHAGGNISEIFGEQFKQQDQYAVQVRMPEPPLLLCDRVTGIDAEPGVHSTGTMWTETDVTEDSWYLHEGRMPTGIMIESGQADLMLISWMGADFLNQGERSYRLLGCDLRFHGPLPQPGETLVYDIHVDGHAKQNDVRLFFFHYDCTINDQVRLSVRGGQAGFFTREELDDSNGILWRPEEETVTEGRLDPPRIPNQARSFTREEIERYANGDLVGAFGPGFEFTQTHTRTPRIQTGDMLFLDEIEVLDFNGGPWGRGYLRAVQHINPDTWFFNGHFKNDPCMPGTLMFEGCVQTMAFYMAAMGLTIDCDGWVFEPVPDLTYKLRCRGQVLPEAKRLTYEVFVKEVHDGDIPMLFADLLCTVDGLKAFHCGRMGLKLSPAWIMDRQTDEHKGYIEPKPVVTNDDGFEFGYDSLLACAWGRPTRAFGEMYDVFDSHRRVARLPGPPYHFISRVTKVDQPMGQMKSGVNLEVEYDVPADVWYFRENGAKVMPYAVLLEAGLQPCGWLASYVGCALSKDIDMYFRNLDGTANQHAEVTPETGVLRTEVVLKSIAQAAGSIIVSFDVEMRAPEQNNELIFTMDTVFGFFPKAALAQQAGLDASDEYKHWVLEEKNDTFIDLTTQPEAFFQDTLRLADPMLLMIDRITGYWPEGGEAGLGRARATKDVDVSEWFFKAHFFQDPVQPGSLGIEAMLQLLQGLMVLKGLHQDFNAPRFEAIATGEAHSWKYRGQVLPKNKLISSSVEINSIERDERGVLAIASASLWVDGMRIYLAKNLAMRIVESNPADSSDSTTGETVPFDRAHDEQSSELSDMAPQTWSREFSLDLDRAPWLIDHCPTYTAPAMPMMSLLDEMAKAVSFLHPDRRVVAIDNVSLKRWVIVDEPQKLKVEVDGDVEDEHLFHVRLLKWWEAPNQAMSRFEEVASGQVFTSSEYPASPPMEINRLKGSQTMPNPYNTGVLFHGPAFHVVESYELGTNGADGNLQVHQSPVPRGVLNPVLLDGALQVIPHDQFYRWCDDLEDAFIAYPYAIEHLRLYGEAPVHGDLQTQVRFVERRDERFVVSDITILADHRIWATMRLVEVLFPKGRLGHAEPDARRAFLHDHRYTLGVGLSDLSAGHASVSTQDYKQSEWFKNTIGTVYHVEGSLEQKTALVAIKDAVGQHLHEHPSRLDVREDIREVTSKALPWLSATYSLTHPTTRTFQAETTTTTLSTDELSQFWQARLGVDESWLGVDVYQGMVEQFVRKVSLEDPEDFASLHGRSVMFLGNHQVQIESLLITAIASCLNGTHVTTMANAKHEKGWVGQLIRQLFSAPGCVDPGNIIYFDQSQPASMLTLLQGLKDKIASSGGSMMVHAPGTRARHNRQEVEKVSSLFLDMAIELSMPIVPVYFSGGLPAYDVENKLEFPVGYGKQDYYIGRAIRPETLAETPYALRRRLVLGGINRLGQSTLGYTHQSNADMVTLVDAHHEQGMDEINAVLLATLKSLESPRSTTRLLLSALDEGRDVLTDDALGQWLGELLERFGA